MFCNIRFLSYHVFVELKNLVRRQKNLPVHSAVVRQIQLDITFDLSKLQNQMAEDFDLYNPKFATLVQN